jgi:hypothetical protein
VIANEAVALSYLMVAHDLGVEINLSKSLESHIGVAEFAKRLLSDIGDLSPISPRLISNLIVDSRYLPVVVRDLADRGLSVKLNKEFLAESPLKVMVRNKDKFYKELFSFLPFDAETLGIVPFLETNTLSPSHQPILLEACDNILNKMSVTALTSAISSNAKTLAKVWQKHGGEVEEDFCSEISYIEHRTGVRRIMKVDYPVVTLFITHTSDGSAFNVLGQVPSSIDIRTTL